MERDRLKRKLKRKTFRNTLLVIIGIVIFLVVLFNYGTQLLIKFSLLLAREDTSVSQNSEDLNYIAAPDLNPVESATNSASITISGSTSIEKAKVKLYINNTLEETTSVTDKNEFIFKDVVLEEGTNEIKAKTVVENGKESSFSEPVTILYRNKAPDLSIDYPSNGQTLKQNQQTLRGKTTEGASVTVNGFRAIVESDGSYSYDIKLNDGGTELKVVATDPAGNKTEKSINVTFAP
jgi:hypothetical protein